MKLIVTPPAFSDIETAHDWYEDQRPGLGAEFAQAVQTAFERISAEPLAYAVRHRKLRRAALKRFPYGLFYRIEEEQILVEACMHVRRDPAEWSSSD